MDKEKFYYFVKADFVKSYMRMEELRIAVQYLSGELKTLLPENVCISNSDFLNDITGESYIDCVGNAQHRIPISEFEDITDRMIKDNGQEIVDGMEINVYVHDEESLVTIYHCHQDEWMEYPPDTRREPVW